jgi:hypothetical protein
VKEEKAGKLELAVFRLAEKPFYELLGEEYIIKDITQDEMENICKSFKDLYEKIESCENKSE